MKRPFVYRRRTVEDIDRHLLRQSWPKALYAAYKRDTSALGKFLRSLPLDMEQQHEIADLIERRIHRKSGKGRKSGVIPSPDLTQRDVVALARLRLRWVTRRDGKLLKGSYRAALEDVYQRLADDGYNVTIDFDQALGDLRRGKRRRT